MFSFNSKYIETLPYFLVYFGVSIAIVAVFLFIYTATTRYPEWRLIREGNVAAAIALAGALLGFVCPLAITIASSINIVDLVIWGVIAMVVQLVAYLVIRRALPELDQAVNAGKTAPAVALAGFAVCVGLLNAACISY